MGQKCDGCFLGWISDRIDRFIVAVEDFPIQSNTFHNLSRIIPQRLADVAERLFRDAVKNAGDPDDLPILLCYNAPERLLEHTAFERERITLPRQANYGGL